MKETFSACHGGKRENGSLGEAYAARLLERKGYQVVARNFHTRFGEIDLILKKDEFLVFVEVKTRAKNALERPAVAVSSAKQRKLILAAEGYLQLFPTMLQPRFDVVEIVTESASDFLVKGTEHFESAFVLTEQNSCY